MKEINEILNYIQQNLKVKKSRYNKFGNYYYRALEDILEAVKLLLNIKKEGKDFNAILTLEDELLQIGERYYIKATATLFWGDQSIFTTAYAREDKERKKFDSSQLTGSASSYARKYALNGLFLIDDTKDSDDTNTRGKPQSRNEQMYAMGKVNKDLNEEAYKKIETRNNAISQYEILLKVKSPKNQNELLKTFKTLNIKEMREVYKILKES